MTFYTNIKNIHMEGTVFQISSSWLGLFILNFEKNG